MPRTAKIHRKTNETDITLRLNLDGRGKARISTGIRFFDHMLELVARHGAFDLKLNARGDLDVDQHHTVEDVGIALGEAVTKALGTKRGILRAGYFLMPMDETLAASAVDFGGRPFCVVSAKIKSARVGDILQSKRRKLPELLSVEMTSSVRDAISTMNRFGVSQLPVFDKGNLVGSLCESVLFQRSMETPEVMELTVGSLLEPPFPTVGPDEDVYEIVQLLKSAPAVLVRDAEKYQGIVTRFDVMGHIGGQP